MKDATKGNLFGALAGAILAMGLITALMAGRGTHVPPAPPTVAREVVTRFARDRHENLRLVPNTCPCEPGCDCDGQCQCEGKR